MMKNHMKPTQNPFKAGESAFVACRPRPALGLVDGPGGESGATGEVCSQGGATWVKPRCLADVFTSTW